MRDEEGAPQARECVSGVKREAEIKTGKLT